MLLRDADVNYQAAKLFRTEKTHFDERLAVKRNLSNEMGSILQPFLHNKALSKVKYDRFLTEKKESLKDRGHK